VVSVLLVEHDAAVAELARRYLAREGFTVRLAGTAGDAGTVFAEMDAGGYGPAAVVLDLTMPGLRAREVRRALSGGEGRGAVPAAGHRGARGRPALVRPLVCLAGPGGLRPREVGVSESACLRRPFGPRNLIARVRAALAAAAPTGDTKLPEGRAGGHGSKSGAAADANPVMRQFAHVALTATERDLLAFLVANPGRVFSRERLLAALAENPGGRATGPAGPRAVDVYVAQLRAKLGDRSPIRTVRGVGYSAEI
jgi:DNA-binding response OmpR family regulator